MIDLSAYIVDFYIPDDFQDGLRCENLQVIFRTDIDKNDLIHFNMFFFSSVTVSKVHRSGKERVTAMNDLT